MAKIRNENLGLDHSSLSSTLNRVSRGSRIMTFARNYPLNFCNLTIAICFVFLALSAQAQTADVNKNWTTVGSAGTLDEKSVGKVFFDQSKVRMGQVIGDTTTTSTGNPGLISTQTDSAVIRYNVTAVESFFASRLCRTNKSLPSFDVQLRLRYLASGPGARVVAKLIEVDLATGLEKQPPLLTFDSAGLPRSDKYQVQSASVCGRPWKFDFENKAYYIEATLTTNSIVITAAGIQMIQIDNFTRAPEVDTNQCASLASDLADAQERFLRETNRERKARIRGEIRELVESLRRLGCPGH